MIRYALALLPLLLAVPAAAQEVRVRSGEHAEFTRLVLYAPGQVDFETDAGKRRFDVALDPAARFETSDVFRRIPRKRVADLSQPEPGRLRIALACDCPVEVTRLSPSRVMVDVKDAPKSGPRLDTAKAASLPTVLPSSPMQLLPGGLPTTLAQVRSRARARATPPKAPDPAPIGEASDIAGLAQIEAARILSEQIARAANQGLLEPAVDAPRPAGPEAAAPEPAEPVPAAPVPAAPASPLRHLAVQSSVDRDMGLRSRGEATLKEALGCLPAAALDVAAWQVEPATGLAGLRAALVGEFDAAQPEAVADLARAYIALTFGAEAAAVVDGFRVEVEDRDLLLAMADIVDHGQTARPGRLAHQFGCEGTPALWAALAAPELPAGDLDAPTVVLAFSGLPPRLRTHLGPGLAERFLRAGYAETASALRNAIVRAPGDVDPAVEVLEARIDIDAGRDAEAVERLTAVVDETSGMSAEAVALLIERQLASGEPVNELAIESAASLAAQMRGTERAARLVELEIAARAARGEVRAALDRLARAEASATLAPDVATRLRADSYKAAAAIEDESAFLLLSVAAADALGRSPEEMSARRAVASRLRAMGLFDLAAELGVPNGSAPPATAPVGPPAPGAPADVAAPLLPDAPPLRHGTELLSRSSALRDRLAPLLSSGETEAAR